MEPSEHSELVDTGPEAPDAQSDRLDYLEARVRELEERIPRTRLLHRRFIPRAFAVLGHYLAAGLMVYLAITLVGFAVSGIGQALNLEAFDDDLMSEGPPLEDVAELPVDASGRGTIQGTPTGGAEFGVTDGTFELVLDPVPTGLPDQTTLQVVVDRSTKAFRDGEALGSPLDAMNDGASNADPSAAGTVIVRFHIKGEQVVADRLDLSDELPPDYVD